MTIIPALSATTRAIRPAVNIDFHFDRNSSCPWYIIIYPAPTVIINAAHTQNTTIIFVRMVVRTLSIVSWELLHISPVPPGVISATLISKLVSVMLADTFWGAKKLHKHAKNIITRENIFLIFIKHKGNKFKEMITKIFYIAKKLLS